GNAIRRCVEKALGPVGVLARPQDAPRAGIHKIAVQKQIAARAPIAQRLAKESVDRAFETGLRSGLEFERKALHLSFASEDAHEGLTAFVEKRRPQWQSR
ncbi:MAG: hypothetical protein J0H06_06885, partial [Actinobacteria bacterium]|nr:hypothetical protein [Actinomycetota bacterium]